MRTPTPAKVCRIWSAAVTLGSRELLVRRGSVGTLASWHSTPRPDSGKVSAMATKFVKVNPADTADVVWQGELGDAADLVAATSIARVAQRGWGGVPAPVRGRVIAQVGRLVEANKQALAELITREIGKPIA